VTESSAKLVRTPLFHLAVAQKARFTGFAGWEMAVQYRGLKQEHLAVRTAAGMFDISHMGKFCLQGKDLIQQLQWLVPSDLEPLQPGEAQYTVLLNSRGGIIDDIIFYYQGKNDAGEQQGILIVNAATTAKDKAWLLTHLENSSVRLEDWSPDKVLIALQGPQAKASFQPLVEEDLSPMKAFTHREVKVLAESAFIARTGYTGEDGWEIMISAPGGQKLWQELLDAGVVPCGLGARDTLRLEAAMCLYGQDMDENTTPLEAGLSWLVHWDSKGDFIGRSALEQQKAAGVQRRLVGLQMEDKGIARHGYAVLLNGEQVGEVTSGTLAPTLNKAIALAYLPKSLAKVGQQLEVQIRAKTYPAVVVKKPFYRSPTRKNK